MPIVSSLFRCFSLARVGAVSTRHISVSMVRRDQETFKQPGAAAMEAAAVYDDGVSSARHQQIDQEAKPIQHTYNFLDDQTEGVACLEEVCVKLDPHAEAPMIPPDHTYNFLDDHTEGVGLDPHAVKEFVPPTHTYSFLDDQTEGVGCLEDKCQKLDPHAVTGVLDDFVPPTHTYNFLDDQTEGFGCLEDKCQKLDPHAVTGVLDDFVPPTHTYSFLDDQTEGFGCLDNQCQKLEPIELINAMPKTEKATGQNKT